MKLRILLLSAILLFATNIQAEDSAAESWTYFFTTSRLSRFCNSAARKDLDICEAYIAGVFDALKASSDPARDAALLTECSKKKLSLRETRQAISKSLSEPSAVDLPASRNVMAAISLYVCVTSEERTARIRKVLGPEPKRDSPDYREYAIMETCMFVMDLSADACRKIDLRPSLSSRFG